MADDISPSPYTTHVQPMGSPACWRVSSFRSKSFVTDDNETDPAGASRLSGGSRWRVPMSHVEFKKWSYPLSLRKKPSH